jgi:hypothetical protein
MQLGRYADGRPLNYDETSHLFDVGGTAVTLEDVVGYDRAGHVEWLSDELRAWALEVVARNSAVQPVGGESQPIVVPKVGRLFGFAESGRWSSLRHTTVSAQFSSSAYSPA